jgi:uncharacterized protein
MSRRNVSIPCGTIVLEGILEIPEGGDMPTQGAVICHPHPLYGGNMNNGVAKAIADGLLSRATVCLRFNFRGTGRSQGTYGQGNDEVDDVRAALDFLQGLQEVNGSRIILAGYSFGCWVGLRAAADDARPGRLIGISPPVDEYDFSFLQQEKRPLLLIAGDRDFVCSHEKFVRLVESIPQPNSGVTLPGADHFHFGREKQLLGHINKFLDEHPWTS